MLNWILKLIPEQYKITVALKKVSLAISMAAVSYLAGTKIGKEIPSEHWETVTNVSSLALLGGLKMVHDWARLKWPNAKWL